MRDWKTWIEDRALHRAPIDQHFRQALAWMDREAASAARAPSLSRILELGPGHSRDLADLFRAAGHTVVQADVMPELPGVVDIGESWRERREIPYELNRFKLILAREVLEHVDDLYAMVEQLHECLIEEGRLWFSSPFVFPLHDYESGDYWRLTPSAWEFLFRRFRFSRWEVRPERLLFGSWQYPTTVLGWAER